MSKNKTMKPMMLVGPDYMDFETVQAYNKVIKEAWGEKYPFVIVGGWDEKWRVLGPVSWFQIRAKRLLKKTLERADFLGRYNFFSQHEQCVLITALKHYKTKLYADEDINEATHKTRKDLVKEFENVHCNCGTCRVANRKN